MEGSIRLLQQRNDNGQELDAVIITVMNGSSYDELFTKVKQESEGGQVLVYQVQPGNILNKLLRVLQGEVLTQNDGPSFQLLNELKAHCSEVGPEAVCVNFECCSGYSDSFGGMKDLHMELTSFLVREYGCLVMFSDFSLKSIIKDWDTNLLGPNPFVEVGEFSGNLILAFDCEPLKASPSSQLNIVGNLCDNGDGKGNVQLNAMSGTIAYTLTREAGRMLSNSAMSEEERRALPYELEVLTVAEELSNQAYTNTLIDRITQANNTVCSASGVRGLAGHVLIKYPPSLANIDRANELEEIDEPARGFLLTSCGHWIELMKIDTNVKRLLEVAANEYGVESSAYAEVYSGLNEARMNSTMMNRKVQEYASKMVQKKSPAKYKKKKF